MSKILLFLLFLIVCDCFSKELVAHIIFSTNQDFLRKYEIKNASDTVVRLGKIRTSCTCADVKYLKSELQPGESTELIVTLKANSLSGPFTHTIYVETDNPKQRFMRFVIKGNAIPLLKVSSEPVQYIGTLQAGKKYEYKYELVPGIGAYQNHINVDDFVPMLNFYNPLHIEDAIFSLFDGKKSDFHWRGGGWGVGSHPWENNYYQYLK